MIKQTIVEELRAKESRDNRELLDRAADYIETLEAEIERLRRLGASAMRRMVNARAEAYKEFAREHRKIMMAFCDDDDQISLKVREYDANTNNLVREKTEGPDNAIQT